MYAEGALAGPLRPAIAKLRSIISLVLWVAVQEGRLCLEEAPARANRNHCSLGTFSLWAKLRCLTVDLLLTFELIVTML